MKERKAELGVKKLCRKYEIIETTLFEWRSKSGGMEMPNEQRLQPLEFENARLKKTSGKASEARFEAACCGLGDQD